MLVNPVLNGAKRRDKYRIVVKFKMNAHKQAPGDKLLAPTDPSQDPGRYSSNRFAATACLWTWYSLHYSLHFRWRINCPLQAGLGYQKWAVCAYGVSSGGSPNHLSTLSRVMKVDRLFVRAQPTPGGDRLFAGFRG